MTSPYDSVILAEPGLVGYFPMDDTSGTGVVDALSANHGTRVNAPTTGVDLGFSAGDKGMTFASSSSQYVTVPNSAAYQFGTGDYSLECWFYRAGDTGASEEYLINRGGAYAGGHGYEVYLGDSGAYATSRMGSVYAQTAAPGWTWGGVWHHLVVTFGRTGYGRYYIDGAEKEWPSGPTRVDTEAAFSVSETATTYLAASTGPTGYLNGGLAKVALYNVELSSTAVARHYAARLLTAYAAVTGHLLQEAGGALLAEDGSSYILGEDATVATTGTGSLTLQPTAVAGTGTQTFAATGALGLGAVGVSGSGAETLTATGQVSLGPATVAGIGTSAGPVGIGSLALRPVAVSATGAESFAATGALTLVPVSVTGAGSETFAATGGITLLTSSVAGSGSETFTASGSLALRPVAVSATGAESFAATGALTLVVPSVAGTGAESFAATGSLTLAGIVVGGSGAESLTGIGSIAFQPVAVSGVGAGDSVLVAASAAGYVGSGRVSIGLLFDKGSTGVARGPGAAGTASGRGDIGTTDGSGDP